MIRFNFLTGWFGDFVQIKKTPYFDDRPNAVEINKIIVHGISLPPGEFGGTTVDEYFRGQLDFNQHEAFKKLVGRKTCPHLFIDREGHITQYVSLYKRAWHAGLSRFNDREHCDDFSIGIELEGAADVPYEFAQYERLAQIIQSIMRYFPAITPRDIIGHSEVSPGRKDDPGTGFDWQQFRSILKSYQ